MKLNLKGENYEVEHNRNQVSYLRFFTMIATSMIIMYFLMYVNSYQILDHAWFSETRFFMTIIMGGAMMAIMLFFMLGMYKNSKANAAIFIGAALMLVLSIWLVRSQVTVTGVDYMEGMIPHHSIAILTSERAGIEDLRVQELAGEIIEAQRKEIREMEWLIKDIKANGVADSQAEAAARPVPEFSGTRE
jgi:FlaA1/EpsC-like NDP-sugar epimerase